MLRAKNCVQTIQPQLGSRNWKWNVASHHPSLVLNNSSVRRTAICEVRISHFVRVLREARYEFRFRTSQFVAAGVYDGQRDLVQNAVVSARVLRDHALALFLWLVVVPIRRVRTLGGRTVRLNELPDLVLLHQRSGGKSVTLMGQNRDQIITAKINPTKSQSQTNTTTNPK